MNVFSRRQCYGFSSLQVVGSVVAVVTGILIGTYVVTSRTPQTLTMAASDYIHLVRNNDVSIEIDNPRKSSSHDYSISGNLCFNLKPPSVNGKYQIELSMMLKDENDPTKIKEELIGNSRRVLVTNPHTLDCSSRVLRRDNFTVVFDLPEKERWDKTCPEITVKIKTEGNWNPVPDEKVATIGPEFFCPDGVPTSSVTPTSGSAQPTSSPTVTQAPAGSSAPGIEGRVVVYSCLKPSLTGVTICNDNTAASCIDIPHLTSPSDQGIWLDDTSQDRTFIYKYRITEDMNGDPLTSGQSYAVHSAFARIPLGGGRNLNIDSSKDEKMTVQVPGNHDLTIHAGDQTCPCVFHALSHVYRRNSNGELTITNELDEVQIAGQDLKNGSANGNQILSRGNKPLAPFTNGSLDVLQDLRESSYDPGTQNPNVQFPYSGGYGKDGFAYVRLFAPEYDVIGQVCVSKGSKQACPNETYKWSKDFSVKEESNKDIKGLRVSCGVDLEYGWIVLKKGETSPSVTTAPTVTPVPSVSGSPSGVPQYNDVFGSLSCQLRNDYATSPANDGCKPANARSGEIGATSARFTWSAPANCSAFTVGTDKYWVIVQEQGGERRVVASKKGIADLNTTISVTDRDDQGLPATIRRIDRWEAGKDYTAHIYAYKDGSSPLCISRPALVSFKFGTGESGSGGDESDEYNAFNMILMDADAQSAMCYLAVNDGGTPIHHNGSQRLEGKGSYSCSSSQSGNNMTVEFTNTDMASDVDGLLTPNSIRIMWQTHRCTNNELACNNNNDGYVDRMTEAADWWCLPKGKTIRCTWDTTKWRTTPPAVRCYVDGQEVTETRTCQYHSAFASNMYAEISIPLAKMDFNNDKVINTIDLIVCLDEYGEKGKKLTCDLNDDETVNALDFSLITSSQGLEVTK